MGMQGTGASLPEALLAQSGWARRLARQLVGEAHADDLVQDALVAGLRRPPSAERGPMRGWLATVLRNLAHNRSAADRRRHTREEAAADVGATAPSAEETLAMVQLHRRLARLIERLPDDDRQIVVLHYFEDRSSADIGQLLRLPAATVRWRLRKVLDQLRAWLDEEAGDRRRWMTALAPLCRGLPLVSSLAPGLAVGIPVGASLLAAVVVTVVLLARERPDRGEAAFAQLRIASERVTRDSGHRPPVLAALAVTPNCSEALARARSEFEAIERDLWQYENPALYFERAVPRPELNARFAPLMAELLAQDPTGVLECREGICRILFVHQPDVEWRPPDLGPMHGRLKAQDVKIDGGKVGGITRDPLSGDLHQKQAIYLRLGRTAPPPPDDSTACEATRSRLLGELAALRERQQRAVPPPVQFERTRSRNHGAEASLRAWLIKLGGERARTLALECRDRVCRFDPTPAWLLELQRRPEWADRLSGGWRGPDGVRYHWLRTPRPAGERDTVREFWDRVNAAVRPVIKRCADRNTTSDIVSIDLLFPGPGELNADGIAERPSLRLAGPAATASLGRCLGDGVTAALATVPVTPGSPAREAKFVVKGLRPAP